MWTLGYRPSDVLQANCVIWVEGPTDRFYLNWWLTAARREHHLVEGVDYQFMTYGGRLLAHFTATEGIALDDGLVERDLIALQALGRRLAIVIDSDKKRDNDTINATKTRVANEIAPRPHQPDDGHGVDHRGPPDRELPHPLAAHRRDRQRASRP